MMSHSLFKPDGNRIYSDDDYQLVHNPLESKSIAIEKSMQKSSTGVRTKTQRSSKNMNEAYANRMPRNENIYLNPILS